MTINDYIKNFHLPATYSYDYVRVFSIHKNKMIAESDGMGLITPPEVFINARDKSIRLKSPSGKHYFLPETNLAKNDSKEYKIQVAYTH